MAEVEKHTPSSTEDLKQAMVALLPNLRAFARSLCSNPAQADDLVQDAIAKALTHIDQFQAGSNLRAWLFTILRNTYYSELRKRRREAEDPDGIFTERLADLPQQDGVVDLEDFKRAFAQLSSDHREVLTLVGAFGVGYEEAAEICGCAVGTVKSRVNRARAKLSEQLGLNAEPGSRKGDTLVMQGAASSAK
jgi:RNA polymerase sigma-70 factor (ECF subfamily)